MMWPIHLSSLPMSTPAASSLETPAFGRELAAIGLEGFKKYRDSILPKELEIDKAFAKEFAASDHSRMNLAFLRWQKRVFADRNGIDPSQLTGRGDVVPRLEGIDYSWPELYDHPIYKRMLSRFHQVTQLYLKRTGYDAESLPKRLRIFPWVEIFHFGDDMRPSARTDGGYAMGRYFAQAVEGSVKFNFEDPRGINPPFGKTHSHAVFQGNLIMYPTWLSHFVTPNTHNTTQVCFAFIAYHQNGNQELDWEEDLTSSMEVKQKIRIPRKGTNYALQEATKTTQG